MHFAIVEDLKIDSEASDSFDTGELGEAWGNGVL